MSARRRTVAALGVALVAAGCGSGGGEDAADGAPSTTSGAVAPAAPVDDTFPELGSASIDVSSYALDLSWDPGTATLTAAATIDLVATAPLDEVPLDFGSLEVTGARVATGGAEPRDTEWQQGGGDLRVALPDPVGAGAVVRVEVEYGGAPEPVPSVVSIPVGWVALEGGGVATPSSPDAAHTWFPCNDVLTDKATFRTTIEVPEGSGLDAIANGVLEGVQTEAGVTRSTWVMDAPMAPYLALVAIDDFDEVERSAAAGVPITDFVPAGGGGDFAGGLGSQPSMMSYFVDRLGAYPFAEYGAVVVPGGNLALETQGRSLFFGPSARDRGTVAHELAHQWIGDSVTATSWRRDVWWVEGFGRYSEWLWAERSEGPGVYAELAEVAYQGMQFGERLPLGDVPPAQLFDRQVYDGGALVFHALRADVGDDAFFTAMRTFAERYRHANATTDDLFEVFAEVAGRDVRPVAEPFLTGAALPPLVF